MVVSLLSWERKQCTNLLWHKDTKQKMIAIEPGSSEVTKQLSCFCVFVFLPLRSPACSFSHEISEAVQVPKLPGELSSTASSQNIYTLNRRSALQLGRVSAGFEIFTLHHTDCLKRLRLFRASRDFNLRNRLLQQWSYYSFILSIHIQNLKFHQTFYLCPHTHRYSTMSISNAHMYITKLHNNWNHTDIKY